MSISGQARVGDVCQGTGVCPVITGILTSGRPTIFTNAPLAVGVGDTILHTCPCWGFYFVGITLSGSSLKLCNPGKIPAHRINDAVSFTCGIGITVSGSPNVLVGG